MAKETKKIGCLGVVGILFLVGFVGSLFSNDDEEVAETNSPSPSAPRVVETKSEEPVPVAPTNLLEATQLQEDELVAVADGLCSPLDEILANSPLFERTSSRAEELARIKDAYDAEEYVQDNSWVRPLMTAETESEVRAPIQQVFNDLLSASQFDGIDKFESNHPAAYRGLLTEFELEVLAHCDLWEDLSGQEDLIKEATRVVGLANNVPWYPKGFTEYADGLTAWNWADRSCSYSSGRCNHMDVVTWIGCQNLYVEVNFLDSSDAVIDWSNDTARGLRAGDMAKLEFVTFEDRARSSRLVEIACN